MSFIVKKEIINYAELNIVGLSVRTKYTNELSFETSQIAKLHKQLSQTNHFEKITNQIHHELKIVRYSNYSSDEYGEYYYFYGVIVENLDNIPDGLTGLIIPKDNYLKLTSKEGQMPEIVFNTWQEIWDITKNGTLGIERSYKVDFEIYDNVKSASVEIYLGIK